MPKKPQKPEQTRLGGDGLVRQSRLRPTSEQVVCLGKTFSTDSERREYFIERLREKLTDPAFKATPGFPRGDAETVLRMSDPPYYTACPNPFLAAWVTDVGRQQTTDYSRAPLAVDSAEGKTDPLYLAHGYHTKVPHRAIVPAILHYTEPGDVVLDGFGGSGMTGVAAQYCEAPDPDFRKKVEADFAAHGRPPPNWGSRRIVLNDLSPAATFIQANYNLPFDVDAFAEDAREVLDAIEKELGWMYETNHSDGKTRGRIDYTVWSEVLGCTHCSREIVFYDYGLDHETGRVKDTFSCPGCAAIVSKDELQRLFETQVDPLTGEPREVVRFVAALIAYKVGKSSFTKRPDDADVRRIQEIGTSPLTAPVPSNRFPIEEMYHGTRLAPKGFTHVHHFFFPRALRALSTLWSKAQECADTRRRNMLLFFVEQAIWGMSVLARYVPTHYSQVNQYLNGVYYIPSQHAECSPWYILEGKLDRLVRAFRTQHAVEGNACVTTGDCAHIPLPDGTIDYVFTDPPFGENIFYADLNFLVESWHRLWTSTPEEAIVDESKEKALTDYQELMRSCFAEYHRVLKPGRWMTVVFHNSKNSVWNAIQEAILAAGFVVADVRTLDKQQGSYRQVTSTTVKQDLVISAYKPTFESESIIRRSAGTDESMWEFVRSHLAVLPTFVRKGDECEVIAERTPHRIFDRMVAFHVQRGLFVPASLSAFREGLHQRFAERDGMYFLREQVAEYDRKRLNAKQLLQLQLIVTDESSAIKWIRQELEKKPQTFQELQPKYMKETQSWARYEKPIELVEILQQNFLMYDGSGPIPASIWSWMQKSSTLRPQMAQATPESPTPALAGEAKNRWHVPDPNKASDLERLREKALLREFDSVVTSQKRIKELRSEACRVGFKKLWEAGDYKAIVGIAKKLPAELVDEDPWLLMYVDLARSRADE